jgi:hypothetical protein
MMPFDDDLIPIRPVHIKVDGRSLCGADMKADFIEGSERRGNIPPVWVGLDRSDWSDCPTCKERAVALLIEMEKAK